MHPIPTLAALAAAFAGALGAQAPLPSTLPIETLRPAVVPVHSAEPDEIGGEYGVWAAGRDYKVSFHDGVAFRPADADRPATVFRWRTTRITAGELPMVGIAQAPAPRWSGTRVEFDHGGIVEAYDVLPEGVEQTFTLTVPPAAGELRIEGRIDGDFDCAPSAARVGALSFTGDDGRASVVYGAAKVIDAAGRSAPVATSFDGERITLQVEADWLATARYPVVVDPLLSRGALAHGGARIQSVDLYRDDQETDRNLWVAYSEFSAAGDLDLFVVRVSEDQPALGSTVVFSDLSASWSAREPRLAGIGGPGKVLTAFVRSFPITVFNLPHERRAVRWHSHAKTSTTLGTLFGSVTQAAGEHDWRPVVGGSSAFAVGRFALIAFQRERGTQQFHNTDDSDVLALLVDLAASERGVAGPLVQLGAQSGRDGERPSVNPEAKGGVDLRWLVAWHFRTGLADDDDIIVAAVKNDGTPLSSIVTTEDAIDATTDKHDAVIAGSDGRYLLAYRQTDRSGPIDRLRVQRIDWPEDASSGRRAHPAVTLLGGQDATFHAGGCAFDTNSRSHWALSNARVANSGHDVLFSLDYLGFRGRRIDSFGVHRTNATDVFRDLGNVVFDDDTDSFPLVFAIKEGSERIRVERLLTASVSPEVPFGSSCSGVPIDWLGSQRVGSDHESLRIRGANVPDAAVFVLGTQTADQDLAPFGMPGCRLLVDLSPASLIGGFAAAGSGGVVQLPIPLIEEFPGLTLHAQAFFVESGSFVSTRAISVGLVR